MRGGGEDGGCGEELRRWGLVGCVVRAKGGGEGGGSEREGRGDGREGR